MCNSKGAQGVVAAAWFADLTTGATRNLASSLSPAFFAGIGNRIPLPGSASAVIIKSVSNLEPEVAGWFYRAVTPIQASPLTNASAAVGACFVDGCCA